MHVTVEIRADGSLENVEISRSSGKKVLDEAALRIVRLAAPFAPFPPDIARDTDILSITRTWSFTLAGPIPGRIAAVGRAGEQGFDNDNRAPPPCQTDMP